MGARTSRRAYSATAGRVLIAALLTMFAPLPAQAANGSFDATGVAVDATSGSKPAGLTVVLHSFAGEDETGTVEAVTDEKGRFAFEDVAYDPSLSYRLSTVFQGVRYWSGELEIRAGEATPVQVDVYQATASPAVISVAEWTIWVDREQYGRVAVQQDLQLVNSSSTTYVGDEPVGENQNAVVKLPVASGAQSFQYLGAFLQCCTVPRSGTFVHTAPILPGTSQGTVRYLVEDLERLVVEAPFNTGSFTLLVPSDVEIVPGQLQPAGQRQQGGITYRVYKDSGLIPGQNFEVGIEGLRETETPPLLLILTALGAAAALASLILWAIALRRARNRLEQQAPAPERQAMPAKRPASPEPQAQREETSRTRQGQSRARQRRPRPRPAGAQASVQAKTSGDGNKEDIELLTQEITALDLAFQRGLLGEDTYRKLRRASSQRLNALQSGDKSESPDPKGARANASPARSTGKGGSPRAGRRGHAGNQRD